MRQQNQQYSNGTSHHDPLFFLTNLCSNMGFWSNLFVQSERDKRREVIDNYNLVPGDPLWFALYENVEPSQLAKETGVPDQLIDDPLLHIAMLKYNRVKALYVLCMITVQGTFLTITGIKSRMMPSSWRSLTCLLGFKLWKQPSHSQFPPTPLMSCPL